MTTTPKTWRELKAEGIHRCCAHFKTGGRCRRRASPSFDAVWCDKHGPIIKLWGDYAMTASNNQTATET